MLDTPTTDPAAMAWLDAFPCRDGTVMISENRPFQHDEADYDDQYGNHDSDESGRGMVNVLRKFDCDLSGPILELGCGTGMATVGLCKSQGIPWFLVTDSSTAFIDIVKRKLTRNDVDPARVRYAVLSDGDLGRLPEASVSAIVLRSVVHHFLDVPGWIQAAGRLLRPGGVIVCEEPAAQGYLIMGIIAQTVADNETNGLTPDQRAKARLMADTMKAYNRCDMDKSTWEDKHLFRPEQMNEWARAAGLESHFLPSTTFEAFAYDANQAIPKTDFRHFFESYLNYCMNFGPVDAKRIASAGDPICSYVIEACAGTREPYLMGVFALRKSDERGILPTSRGNTRYGLPPTDSKQTSISGNGVPEGGSLEALRKMEAIEAVRPLQVNIETTTLCNARCTFCAYPKVSRPKTIMTMELFEKLCSDFDQMGGGLFGLSPMMSDPLIDPLLLDRVELVNTKFPSLLLHLFTNLIGLKRFSDDQVLTIIRGVRHIDISIGGLDRTSYATMFGVDKFDTVYDGMVRLAKLRNSISSPCLLRMHVRTTDVSSILSHPKLQELKQLGYTCNDIHSDFTDFGGIVTQDHLPNGATLSKIDRSGERQACFIASGYLGVTPDGQAAGCVCFDGRGATTVGDANSASLSEIWHSDRAKAFRSSFADGNVQDICKSCAFYIPKPKMFSNPGLLDFDYRKESFWEKLS